MSRVPSGRCPQIFCGYRNKHIIGKEFIFFPRLIFTPDMKQFRFTRTLRLYSQLLDRHLYLVEKTASLLSLIRIFYFFFFFFTTRFVDVYIETFRDETKTDVKVNRISCLFSIRKLVFVLFLQVICFCLFNCDISLKIEAQRENKDACSCL